MNSQSQAGIKWKRPRPEPIAPTPWAIQDQTECQCVVYVVDARGEVVCEVWDLPMGYALPIARRIVEAQNRTEET